MQWFQIFIFRWSPSVVFRIVTSSSKEIYIEQCLMKDLIHLCVDIIMVSWLTPVCWLSFSLSGQMCRSQWILQKKNVHLTKSSWGCYNFRCFHFIFITSDQKSYQVINNGLSIVKLSISCSWSTPLACRKGLQDLGSEATRETPKLWNRVQNKVLQYYKWFLHPVP